MGQTWVARALERRWVVAMGSRLPVPLRLARPFLLRDNDQENRADGWGRLRDASEAARYDAVRSAIERYAGDGFVLDVGCSQGLLQAGLRYGRYLGIDSYPQAIARASHRADARTSFRQADGADFRPDQPPTAVVLNEVLYYLPRPLAVVTHYARVLAPGGVLVVSMLDRSWATRRLDRRIGSRYRLLETCRVGNGGLLSWRVSVFRP